MTKNNLKKLIPTLLIRFPIIGTLVLLNIAAGYVWEWTDRAVNYLNDKLPGLTKDENGRT